ncbi:ArsA family ATPase [Nocardia cyriacigeorgica]|uniref:ArsA family ATPase n=1 Tax=Nocardia cyriacigeorgica TaxID=135487 RepID=UPI0018940CA6|nr:ArsA-related P-loop ATPase [Nocardia cyriacigeorgica]MBF6101994.1 ArsA family ATPase [Nocardia cyriacigeorgica]MBF6160269.1 ArsA family ATPase [Nocardia cyriacigeorgica]MBF6199353.1 ArsA family ATPase [Nocardia cyriacigeorgica]MBF6315212.1 ArsA family ATPase [Nocardia cyriacigeorgica]MBF6324612.1 ArsA family ATPase [Nocardia cyriacigeorgica]
MPVSADPGLTTGWPERAARARLHYVSGKGGTGKSTVAAALALALAAGGRRVLLVEVESRQSIAQLFDLPPLPPTETRIATADGGGEVVALALDIEHAFLEYLDMFYNLGFAGRAMRRMGAIEFVTTIAPGLRDVILTGKIKECAVRVDKTGKQVYDEIVVDSPPTGRIASFLDVTQAMAEVAKGGPIASQAEGVSKLLHSDQTLIHLVTLLEALPVQETADAIAELTEADLRIGTVIVNRASQDELPAEQRNRAAAGDLDLETIRAGLDSAGISLPEDDFQGLITEAVEHSATLRAQDESATELAKIDVSRISLPALTDGMDLGGLYELAEHLTAQGVR